MSEINYGMLAAQIVNILLLLGIIALTVFALVRLSKDNLSDDAKMLWTVLIVLFPILGPAAYFILCQPAAAARKKDGAS